MTGPAKNFDSVNADKLLNDLLEGDDTGLAGTLNSRMSDLVDTHAYGDAGGRMWLSPSDTYVISEAIEYEDGVRIVGDDRRSANIQAESGFADSTMFDVTPTSNTWFGGMEMVRLDGNRANATTKGIYASASDGGNPKDVQFPYVFIRDTENQGIHLDSAGWGYRFDHLLVEGCGSGTNYAVHISDQKQVHVTGEPFIAYNQSDWAVYLENTGTATQQNQISGWWLFQNDKSGLQNELADVIFSNIVAVANSQASANTHYSIELTSTANGCTVTNSVFAGAGGQTRDGLRIFADNCTVSNCQFAGHGNNDLLVAGDGNKISNIQAGGTITVSGVDNRLSNVDASTITDNGTRTRLDDRYLTPPTFDLGGTNGQISPTNTGVGDRDYTLKVQSSGSTATLTGVQNIADDGTILRIVKFGSNNVTIDHNANTTTGFWCEGSANVTMDTVGETWVGRYDSAAKSNGRWVQIGQVP